MKITEFGGGCEHTIGHIQLVLKVEPLVGLTTFHVLDSSVSYHLLLGGHGYTSTSLYHLPTIST